MNLRGREKTKPVRYEKHEKLKEDNNGEEYFQKEKSKDRIFVTTFRIHA